MKSAPLRVLMVIVVVSLVMSACATVAPAPAGEGAEVAATEVAEITMWIGVGSQGSEQAECRIASVIDPYNEMTEDVNVTVTLQPNNWDATRTAVAGGGGPDVLTTPGPSFVFEMAKAGQVLPLDDFADRAWLGSDLRALGLESGTCRWQALQRSA